MACSRPVGNTGFGHNARLNMLQPTRHHSSRAHGSCVRERLHEGEPAAANCSRCKRLHDEVMRAMPAHHHHTLITSQWAGASHALACTQSTAVHELPSRPPRLAPSPAVQNFVSLSATSNVSVRPPGRLNTRTSRLRHLSYSNHGDCRVQRRRLSLSLEPHCCPPVASRNRPLMPAMVQRLDL